MLSAIWRIPTGFDRGSVAGALLNDWQVGSIVRMRSGNPLTVFVQTNRSRSLWAPSLGPGTGPDRPSYAPGRGPDDAVTGDPGAGSIQRRSCCRLPVRWATSAATISSGLICGRRICPSPSRCRGARPVAAATSQLRVEIFNVFNRVNFGPPSLVAFSGMGTETAPLASFGQIRSTITSARQMQLGVRFTF